MDCRSPLLMNTRINEAMRERGKEIPSFGFLDIIRERNAYWGIGRLFQMMRRLSVILGNIVNPMPDQIKKEYTANDLNYLEFNVLEIVNQGQQTFFALSLVDQRIQSRPIDF